MATVMDGVQETASLSFPIVRKEYTPDGDMLVWGPATDGTVDSDRQIVDTDWSGKALQEWLATGGNVRVQHSPHLYPAGKGVEVEVGKDGAHWVRALVVEPTAKSLVEKGVLTAFSVGIARPQIVRSMDAPGGKIVGGQIAEVSLVDRPANKNCVFQICKSADDGTAEFVGKVFGNSPLIAATQVNKRDFSRSERDEAADSGAAMKDGSFPIKNGSDLDNAIHLAGNAKNPEAARSHIKRRAAALGHSDKIPDSWKADGPDVEKADGRHCPKCGEGVGQDALSCPECGSKIGKSDGPDVEARADADLDKDDDRPAFLQGKAARPTDGVRAKDSKTLPRHREPDGGVMEDFEDDAGLQEGDSEPGGQGLPNGIWNDGRPANTPDTMKGDFVGKVGPKGYSHGWVKVNEPNPPKKGEDIAFHHEGKRFVGFHGGKAGSDHVRVNVPSKEHKDGDYNGDFYHRFKVPITEAERPNGNGSAWNRTHPATAKDLQSFKKKARKNAAKAKISAGHPSVTGPGRGTINSAGNRVGKSLGAEMTEAPYAIGRLHDALCAAYTEDVVKSEYPSMGGTIGAMNGAWPDLDPTARDLVKSIGDVLDDEGLVLDDARASLTKSFGDMYPNVRLTPGKISAGQFTRPYLSAGHPAMSASSEGSQHSPSQAGFGSSTEMNSASQFNRANITEGHARTSAGSGGNNGNSIPGARSAGQRLAAASKNIAANAMQKLHDHLADQHPYLCPMSPGTPGQLEAVSKGEIEQVIDKRIEEIRKGYEHEITELRGLIDQLGSQPDPGAAPHRGVTVTKSASGGTGPVDRRSLVEEAQQKESNERRAFYASMAQSGDPQMREAARKALGTPEN